MGVWRRRAHGAGRRLLAVHRETDGIASGMEMAIYVLMFTFVSCWLLGLMIYGLLFLSAVHSAREGARSGSVSGDINAAQAAGRRSAWMPQATVTARPVTVQDGSGQPTKAVEVTTSYDVVAIPYVAPAGRVSQTVTMREERQT
jgi:hypothetical protein